MSEENEKHKCDAAAEQDDVQSPAANGADSPAEKEACQAPCEPTDPITALEMERDDLLGRLQRLGADYRNYETRARRGLDQTREFANEELIKSLLPVLDDMERALAAAADNHGEDDPLFKGMQMVHDHAIETLQRWGLTPVQACGKEFDPDLHVAILQEESADKPAGTVLREVQKGYQFKGRTIRPTSVIVSKAPDEIPPPGENQDNQSEEDADKPQD